MSLEKSNLSKTHMGHSVEFNFFKKFKAIESYHCPYLAQFQIFFKKKDFSENPVPGHGNLVLITSTV